MTTKQKHEISIPGLPEGWRAMAYRIPVRHVDYIWTDEGAVLCHWERERPELVVEKIKPRRIVLEETGEPNNDRGVNGNYAAQYFKNGLVLYDDKKIWRLVEEECAELNPWQTIESAPKDRKVLFYFPTYGIYEDFYENIGTLKMVTQLPTHWMELPPEPPKT